MRLGSHKTVDLSTLLSKEPNPEILGRGSYGIVYAVTADLGEGPQALALKQTFAKAPGDDGCFQMEAIAHSLCSGHSSILTFHAYQGPEKPGGPYYLLMDRASGTLETLIEEYAEVQRNRPDEAQSYLSLQRAVLAQLLPGLHHMRRRGIVHGDIKPANIFLHNGRLVIADFGAACLFGRDYAGVGTGFDLPPDIFSPTHSHLPHFNWDLWAAAIIARQLLPGGLTEAGCYSLRYETCQLPSNLQAAASSFPCSMLQRDSNRRLTLDQVMSHPFLHGVAWGAPDPRFTCKGAHPTGLCATSQASPLPSSSCVEVVSVAPSSSSHAGSDCETASRHSGWHSAASQAASDVDTLDDSSQLVEMDSSPSGSSSELPIVFGPGQRGDGELEGAVCLPITCAPPSVSGLGEEAADSANDQGRRKCVREMDGWAHVVAAPGVGKVCGVVQQPSAPQARSVSSGQPSSADAVSAESRRSLPSAAQRSPPPAAHCLALTAACTDRHLSECPVPVRQQKMKGRNFVAKVFAVVRLCVVCGLG